MGTIGIQIQAEDGTSLPVHSPIQHSHVARQTVVTTKTHFSDMVVTPCPIQLRTREVLQIMGVRHNGKTIFVIAREMGVPEILLINVK